jgi:hypothetical protein
MSSKRIALYAAAAAPAATFALAFVILRGGLAPLPMHDFVEYWAAGRLMLSAQNPYDAALVHDLERQAGNPGEGFLMWNPPWVMPLVMPLGLMPVRLAHALWLILHLVVLAFCADRLWRIYGGPPSRRLVALALAATFAPAYIAIIAGQISPLMLLGAVLFLDAVRRGENGWAGAACALLAIKPHLAYLFWIAVIIWAVRERRWGVLLGGGTAGALLTVVAGLFVPEVVAEYWRVLTTSPPSQYRSPTLGMLVRLAIGDGAAFRWQFLPMLPGLAWLAVHLWRNRSAAWDWAEQLPLLLLVSILTTPYGGWPFDLVLLLVPAVRVAVLRPRIGAVIAHGAINGLAFLQVLRGVEYLGFVWMTPALLAAYVGLLRLPVDEPAPGVRPA